MARTCIEDELVELRDAVHELAGRLAALGQHAGRELAAEHARADLQGVSLVDAGRVDQLDSLCAVLREASDTTGRLHEQLGELVELADELAV